VPTVQERIAGLLERWPDRCTVPVSEEHGTKLRREAFEESETVEETVEVGEHEEITTYETVERSALPLIAVVEEFLEMYESYRDLHLKLEKREPNTEPEEFLISLINSYSPEYQEKQYAKMCAWDRQILGGEYPHGEEVEGAFEEPVATMFSLTGSGYRVPGEPESGLRPICDHDRDIRDAWTGSSGSVKRTLRYVLEDSLGLSSDEYTWHYQSEPHPGDSTNAGYSHAHPILVFDGAAANTEPDAISSETFRPVVAKHIAECDGATWDGHSLENAVEVRTADEINSLSGYAAKYVQVDPDKDLLERSDEYIMWAASQWATATQKYSRDRVATAATKADACHQEYVSEESHQDRDHGETVVRSKKPGVSYECLMCGSSFGIDQECSLTEHRTAQTPAESACAADGGEAVERETETADGLSDGLRAAWKDAQSAARIEEPVGGGEVESASFRRPARWEPVSVVRTWSDEEESVGAPSGVEYEELVVEGAGAAVRKIPERCLVGEPGDGRIVSRSVSGVEPPDGAPECVGEHVRLSEPERRPGVGVPSVVRLPLSGWLEGPEPWERHPVDESDVREGILPPPEVLAKEHGEHYNGRRITPKEWPSDWYAERYEKELDGEADRDGLTDRQRMRVIQLVENESVASAVEVAGRLELPPESIEEIEVLLE
jgi:hypothetical protein